MGRFQDLRKLQTGWKLAGHSPPPWTRALDIKKGTAGNSSVSHPLRCVRPGKPASWEYGGSANNKKIQFFEEITKRPPPSQKMYLARSFIGSGNRDKRGNTLLGSNLFALCLCYFPFRKKLFVWWPQQKTSKRYIIWGGYFIWEINEI